MAERERAHLPDWFRNLARLCGDLPDGAALVRDAPVASNLVVKGGQDRLDVHRALLRGARVCACGCRGCACACPGLERTPLFMSLGSNEVLV